MTVHVYGFLRLACLHKLLFCFIEPACITPSKVDHQQRRHGVSFAVAVGKQSNALLFRLPCMTMCVCVCAEADSVLVVVIETMMVVVVVKEGLVVTEMVMVAVK